MNKEQVEKIGELIENSAHVCSLLINSEIAMNDGDITVCQKNTKEAQNMLKTMIGDIFIEVKETFNITCDETNDYDLPGTLELAKQLSDVCFNSGILLAILADNNTDSTKDIVIKKIIKAINTSEEIYNCIFAN